MADLRGKKVLITGASRGVGVAAARRFAAEGADVALLARGRDGLETAAAEARAQGVKAHVIVCDVSDREQVQRAVYEAVEKLDGLDVLVSNAAAVVFGPFAEVGAEDFDRVMDVTFRGPVDLIRAALPTLEANPDGGVIVVTGSLMARNPLPMFSSYSAAKHALRGFLGTLRIELAERGSKVQVTMVHPGAIDTPLWHQVTSATGRLPRVPPEGYTPDAVAQALVSVARQPKREMLLGIETRVLDTLIQGFKPAGDIVLRLMYKYFDSGTKDAPPPGALHESPNLGEESGRVVLGRPSLSGALRYAWTRRVG